MNCWHDWRWWLYCWGWGLNGFFRILINLCEDKGVNSLSVHTSTESTPPPFLLAEGIFCLVFDTIHSCSARSKDSWWKRQVKVNGREELAGVVGLGETHSDSKQWNVPAHSLWLISSLCRHASMYACNKRSKKCCCYSNCSQTNLLYHHIFCFFKFLKLMCMWLIYLLLLFA